MMMRSILLVAAGGGLGSAFRYLTSVLAIRYFQTIFPVATFAVNILGCLAMGLLLGIFERYSLTNPDLKFLFVTGFCGGYTTFSAFAYENYNLFQTGHGLTAFLYMASSIIVGLAAVWIGMALVR